LSIRAYGLGTNTTVMNAQAQIRFQDVALVYTFIAVLVALFIHARAYTPQMPTTSMISVDVCISENEIKTLLLPAGSTVADIFAQIPVSKVMDLEKRFMEEKLSCSSIFVVPQKNKTSVFVLGKVKRKGLYIMPEGATYKDLIAILEFEDEANLRSFARRRRALREGEVIDVP
jgi:hypothetical protein